MSKKQEHIQKQIEQYNELIKIAECLIRVSDTNEDYEEAVRELSSAHKVIWGLQLELEKVTERTF